MENVLLTMKDPEFWKFMMIIGGIVVAFNLIRFFVVICKVRKAETYLYQGSEVFNGMSMGSAFIAIGSFMREMTVVGVISSVFVVVFFCCDRKYMWISNNSSAMQEAQDMLDSTQTH